MKRFNWSVLVAVGLGCLLFAGKASAQSAGTGTSSSNSAAGTPLIDRTEGKVQSIDAAKKLLTLSDGTIQLGWGTNIVKDGEVVGLKDIKEGDQVRASYTDADPFHAARVEVKSAKATTN